MCVEIFQTKTISKYIGDLIFSYSSCVVVDSTKVVVWTYAIFVTAILGYRCPRDEKRISAKYGTTWGEYYQRVSWRLVLGIWWPWILLWVRDR